VDTQELKSTYQLITFRRKFLIANMMNLFAKKETPKEIANKAKRETRKEVRVR
jgi:hypothetical protein